MRKEWDVRLTVMAGKVAHAARKDAKRKAQLGKAALMWWIMGQHVQLLKRLRLEQPSQEGARGCMTIHPFSAYALRLSWQGYGRSL